MGIYRNISTRFWSDPTIVQTYTPEDKFFFMYLLTNEHTTLCGTITIGTKTMANEIGYSEDSIKSLIERHYKIHKTILYDQEHSEILIRNWCKYNWTSSPKVISSVYKQLRDISSPLHRKLVQELLESIESGIEVNQCSIPYRYHSVSDSVSVTDNISNSSTNIDIEKPIPKRVKKDKSPKPPESYEQVLAYAKENNRECDAERFWKFFEAGDWFDSKGNPVLNWKQKFQTWGMYNKDKQKEKTNELKDLWNKKEKENGNTRQI